MPELRVQLLPFQSAFVHSPARFPAFVAGWGTGKTLCGLVRGLIQCQSPDNLGLVVRREFTDLRDSTMRDFERYTGLSVNANKDVRVNKSTIMFRHGDELNTLKNINLGWFLMEQAEEFETDAPFQFLRGRLRRSSVTCHTGFIVANTAGHNWVHRLWKAQRDAEFPLTEARTFDNPHLPADYLADLRRLETEAPATYRRYVLNSWDEDESADQLISYALLTPCFELGLEPAGGSVLACDPARYGDCQTVITELTRAPGRRFVQTHLEAHRGWSLMQTAGRLIDLIRERQPDVVVIDDTGLGGGLSDRLSEQQDERASWSLLRFQGGAKSERGFVNLRAERYWELRRAVEARWLGLLAQEEQTAQLTSLRFRYKSDGERLIETKDHLRQRGLPSPDYADALMMAYAGCANLPEVDSLGEPADASDYVIASMEQPVNLGISFAPA